MHYQIFSALIGLSFFVIAFLLVRRDTILPGSALRWTLLSLLILILGLFPQLSDVIATAIGITYPPIIPVLVAIMVIFIKLLISDIERTKDRVKMERLIQRIAMLENEVNNK